VCLDAGAVDEQPIRHTLGSCQRAKNVLPDTAFGPTHEAVVEGLFGTIDRRAIAPTAAALQRMHDPRQYTTVIDPPRTLAIDRQQRLDPRPLIVRKPKEIRHCHASSLEALNHMVKAMGIRLLGPDPRNWLKSKLLDEYWEAANFESFHTERPMP
jgi:hypothetical protein